MSIIDIKIFLTFNAKYRHCNSIHVPCTCKPDSFCPSFLLNWQYVRPPAYGLLSLVTVIPLRLRGPVSFIHLDVGRPGRLFPKNRTYYEVLYVTQEKLGEAYRGVSRALSSCTLKKDSHPEECLPVEPSQAPMPGKTKARRENFLANQLAPRFWG